jgi:hypothetical protein
MARARERVCLQDGLKLDLNRLARNGFIRRGTNIGSRGIRWTHSYWGEIASGVISADTTRAGCEFNSGIWIRQSPCLLIRDISVVGNGTSFVRLKTAPRQYFGSPVGPQGFAVGRPGADRSLTNRSSMMRQAGRTADKPR